MPTIRERTHRQDFEVMMDAHHFSIRESRLFDSSYLAANSYSERWLYKGMIVAKDTSTNKFVPYSASAAYGTGSDTALGVNIETLEMTYGDIGIAPMWHGKVREAYAFVYGGARGTIPAAVKTSLDDVEWI